MNAIPKEWEKRQWARAYNRETGRFLEQMEIRNAFFNHYTIWHDMHKPAEGRTAALSVADFKLAKPEPILILGSGPSLDHAGPLLSRWKGAIMASTSQAASCIHWGHAPEFVLALDVQTRVDELQRADTWEGRPTTLLTHPCIAPRIIDYWTGKKLYFRPMEPANELYLKYLPLGYDFIKTHMFCFACSLAAQLGLAHAMGFSPLILVGCDFAAARYRAWYHDAGGKAETHRGKIRLTRPSWKHEPPHGPPDQTHLRIAENGVLTDRIQVYYKRAVLCVARLDKTEIINASPQGILTEFPTVSFEEVLDRQNAGYEDLYWGVQKKLDAADLYLARNNVYVIPLGDGLRFYECGNWKQDIPVYCIRLNAEMAAAPNAEALRSKHIDIEAFMKRVAWLHETNRANGFAFSGEVVPYDAESGEAAFSERQKKFGEELKKEIEEVNRFAEKKLPVPPELPTPSPGEPASEAVPTTHVPELTLAASVKTVIDEKEGPDGQPADHP